MTRLRVWQNFRANPSSLRLATVAITSISVILVVVGAMTIRIFDADEYPTMGDALWFALQTVTTVGYGDNTPTTAVGRIVASVVMLVSIGLITMITAVITSLFIESAGRRRTQSDLDATAETLARIEASLASTDERLDRIEKQSAPRPSGVDDAN
jgi:voltage-gated potassium channel